MRNPANGRDMYRDRRNFWHDLETHHIYTLDGSYLGQFDPGPEPDAPPPAPVEPWTDAEERLAHKIADIIIARLAAMPGWVPNAPQDIDAAAKAQGDLLKT